MMLFTPILLIILFMGVPLLLTIFNLYNLFAHKKFKPNIIDSLVFILGIIFTWILYDIFFPIWGSEWLMSNFRSAQQPIFSYPPVIVLAVIALIGYVLLRKYKLKFPQSAIAFCFAAMGIGCIISVIWISQVLLWNVSDNYFSSKYFLCLFPFNYIISCISLFRIITKKMRMAQSQIP